MTADAFVDMLTEQRFSNVFNPYSQQCPVHDLARAPDMRCRMVLAMIGNAAERGTDSLWIGRDLGYRGGRRTGLAMTDDFSLEVHARRWSIVGERPTRGTMIRERTSTAVWDLLGMIEASVFLWNVFPFHPHTHNNPFSNRPHSSAERRVGRRILGELIRMLRPRRIVAVGGLAAGVIGSITSGEQCVRVRHPSYGGQREFVEGMLGVYRDRGKRS